MEILLFLLGGVTLRADFCCGTAILNVCMYYGIQYVKLKTLENGIEIKMRLSEFKRLKKLCEERDIGYEVVKEQGIPVILSRYRKRYGIALGVLLAIAGIIAAHQFVWSIEVEGNSSLTSAEVKALMAEHGFSAGSLISSANTDRIENAIMIDSSRISWMSINIIGTVAHVQIRENQAAPPKDTSTKPANLVAKKAGMVEEMRLFRGNAVVSAGRYVEKGQLLVSGLFDSQQLGFRYTRAAGMVMARTEEQFVIEIPYEYEQKVYTGQEYCEKYLNFFDFSINILKKGNKKGQFYDKIDIVEDCDLFGIIRTPFSKATVKYMEYETAMATRSEDEALTLAYRRLDELLGDVAEQRVVVKKTVSTVIGKDSVMLICTVVSIENIAEVAEFEVDYSN